MLTVAFLLSSFTHFMQGLFLPRFSILAFAPYLSLLILRNLPLPQALWLSALAGCLVDIFSDDPMGLHALNYTLCASLLFRFRKHFSHTDPLHISLFTGILSFLSTLLQLMLLFLFDRRVPFDGKWIFADIIGMPVIDAVYAFVWFAAPLALFEKIRRIWVVYWLKKKNPSLISR